MAVVRDDNRKFTIYAPKEYITRFFESISDYKFPDILSIRRVPTGTVMVDARNSAYGVFDADGQFVEESTYSLSAKCQRLPKYKSDAPYFDFDIIYCGWDLFRHFGHFLLENVMARMAPCAQYKDIAPLFVSKRKSIPSFVSQTFDLIGNKAKNPILINQSARFRNIYLVPQAFSFNKSAYRDTSKLLRIIADNAKTGQTFERVYLSRAKMGDLKIHGEEVIQKIFEKNGYKILYPETMTVEEQISAVKNCKYLAGCTGSAMHLALFMSPGSTVVCLKRNSDFGDNMGTQYILDEITGLNTITVWTSIEKETSEHFTDIPQIIGDTKYLREFFDDMGFVYTDQDLTIPADILEEYKSHMKRIKHRKRIIAFKRPIVRLVASFIPTRPLRRQVREHMTKLLRC